MNNTETKCDHPYPLEDNGYVVCDQCGLVLEDHVFRAQDNTPFDSSAVVTESLTDQVVLREMLLEIMHRLCVDAAVCFVDAVLSRLELYSRTGPPAVRPRLQKVRMGDSAHRGLMAFIVLEVLHEQGCFLDHSSLCHHFDITSRDLLRAEKDLEADFPFLPPSLHLPRVLACLHLPLPLEHLLRDQMLLFDESFRSAEVLVSAMLTHVGRVLRRHCRVQHRNVCRSPAFSSMLAALTAKHLSNTLIISVSSIHRTA